MLDAVVSTLSAYKPLHDEDLHIDGDEHLRHGTWSSNDVTNHVV